MRDVRRHSGSRGEDGVADGCDGRGGRRSPLTVTASDVVISTGADTWVLPPPATTSFLPAGSILNGRDVDVALTRLSAANRSVYGGSVDSNDERGRRRSPFISSMIMRRTIPNRPSAAMRRAATVVYLGYWQTMPCCPCRRLMMFVEEVSTRMMREGDAGTP